MVNRPEPILICLCCRSRIARSPDFDVSVSHGSYTGEHSSRNLYTLSRGDPSDLWHQISTPWSSPKQLGYQRILNIGVENHTSVDLEKSAWFASTLLTTQVYRQCHLKAGAR